MQHILGISLGTRSLGIVVIEDDTLIDWRIKTFRGSWSNEKLKKIILLIDRYVQRNKITKVAIKIPKLFYHSPAYTQLIGGLNVFYENRKIQIQYYTLSDLKKHSEMRSVKNKKMFIRSIAEKYVDLYHLIRKEEGYKREYYTKVFEAVAAAAALRSGAKSK